MNNKGKLWEIEAANYLRKHKYKLVDVNYTTRFGEIDLIVQKKNIYALLKLSKEILIQLLYRENLLLIQSNKK